jgi:transposase
MIAIGVDVHKRKCTVAQQGEDGELKMWPAMDNTREAWRKFLPQLPPAAEIALEVSTSGYFAMSVLEEAGWRERAHWVHTAGIDSLRKQKTDRLDARRLARKLAANTADPLPEAWFPPPEIRELRLRARQRCWLTAQRARIRNRVQSLLQRHGLRSGRNPFSKAGQAWLAQQAVPAATRETLDQLGRLHEFLQQEVMVSEMALEESTRPMPEIARLRTIPGLGRVLAAVVWSEMGDRKRFASADAWVNYTGLVSSLYESGDVSVRGPITRQGPAWLRWALITGVNAAVRGQSALARRYRRLKQRKPANVAKTAVARSLARCVYGVLKNECDYQEERWGRRLGSFVEQQAGGSPRSTKTVS